MKIRRPFGRKSHRSTKSGNRTGTRRRKLSLENLESRAMLSANAFGLSPATDYSVGQDPVSILNADLNRDGYLDLAVANLTDNTVSVRLGNNDGTFGSRTNYTVGTSPCSVVLGDANNDGRMDILTANSGSDTISILLATSSGGFSSAITVEADYALESLAVGDVNNDDINDIVYTNTSDRTFSLLLGTSKTSAEFEDPIVSMVGNHPVSIILADFNKDSNLDVATANRDDATASVLLGNGQGQFTSQIAYTVGSGPQSITTGILTGDPADTTKYTDLVVASRYDSTVTVLVNNGNGAFTNTGQFDSGTWSAAVAIGDINGDELADLVTADEGGNSISVLCGRGDGTFGPNVPYSVGTYPDDVTLGDFDSDGHLDIATANHLDNSISVLLGDRRFAPSKEYKVYDTTTDAIGTYPAQAVLGDLNNDGYIDVLSVNKQTDNLSVLLNDKTGAFDAPLAPLLAVDDSPRSAALGDLDGDGNLDVVVSCGTATGPGSVSILKGNGNGVFDPRVSMSGFGPLPIYVTLADLDNDGNLDLVTVNQKPDTISPNTGSLSVAFGNGDTTFTAPIKLYVGSTPRSVAVGDLDNDGVLDLVATSQTSQNVAVLINNGNRTFQAADFVAVKASPYFAKIGDVDNDGAADIVTSNYTGYSISMLPGNNDGTFDDAIVSETRYRPYDLVLQDLNGSGDLDVAMALPNEDGYAVLDGDGTGKFAAEHNYTNGEDPVSIAAADLDGNGQLDLVVANRQAHSISACLGNGYLDTVAQSTYNNLMISSNLDHWYSINTGVDGVVSIEVIYQGAAGDVTITLYNETGTGTALATSTATALPGGYISQRIDYPSTAGKTYTFKISGSATNATLHATSSTGAAVYGTSGNDVFELTPGAPDNTVTVTTGAVTSTYTFDATTIKSIFFDGLEGTDRVVYTGTAADDTAVVYPSTGTMSRTDLALEWQNFEEARLDGGGGTDVVSFYDSEGDDTFGAADGLSLMQGTGFDNQAANFFYAHGYSENGGEDTANLYGSANDNTLVTTPKYAKITSSSYYANAHNFRYAKAYAGPGGNDVAMMNDSSGNDTFVATPTYAKMYSNSYYTRATDFRYVKAYANSGGTDTAQLSDDATDDTFICTPSYGKLTGANFYIVAHNFDSLVAYANGGGNDTAKLVGSTGDDTFSSNTVYSIMSGTGYSMRAQYFDEVLGQAVAGGNDRAYLADTAGNYTLTAAGKSAKIAENAATWSTEAWGFAWVQATASSGGGTHTKVIGATDYVLELMGPWV
ncbi:MAG: VCBS repeat-containing protein [Pirellulales bacterium]|nr:VCBS repeat-containing protein [Pirellulales bacterium]